MAGDTTPERLATIEATQSAFHREFQDFREEYREDRKADREMWGKVTEQVQDNRNDISSIKSVGGVLSLLLGLFTTWIGWFKG